MPRVNVNIPWKYRLWIFIFVSLSWCTGLAFFIMNRWVTIEGDFGPEKHAWQYPILKVHGAFCLYDDHNVWVSSRKPHPICLEDETSAIIRM